MLEPSQVCVVLLKFPLQYTKVQYSTVKYSSVKYSTVQYGTVQYSTVQYSTELQETFKAWINLITLFQPGEWRFLPSWIQILLLVASNLLINNKPG